MYHKNPTYRIFYLFNIAFLVVCVLPLLHIFAVSLSGKSAADSNLVGLIPVDFSLDGYLRTFENSNFLSALRISVLRSTVGTILAMCVTVLAAFPLSRNSREFRGRSFYVWFFLIIMIFDAGLVPHYILMEKINLINSFWIFILPGLVNVWNIILMMNFFRALPRDLDEAAIMDGATSFQIMSRIYLPVSLPAIATLSLFTLVGHWNAWFDGMLYMTRPTAGPLPRCCRPSSLCRTSARPASASRICKRSPTGASNPRKSSSPCCPSCWSILFSSAFSSRASCLVPLRSRMSQTWGYSK